MSRVRSPFLPNGKPSEKAKHIRSKIVDVDADVIDEGSASSSSWKERPRRPRLWCWVFLAYSFWNHDAALALIWSSTWYHASRDASSSATLSFFTSLTTHAMNSDF